MTACALCGFDPTAFLCRDKRREFFLCGGCGLVSVPERYWLDADGERARYALHDNSASNAGYAEFLSQVADVAAKLSPPGAKALDFGSGESAALCRMLTDRGIDCSAYDPLYGRLLPYTNHTNGVNETHDIHDANDARNFSQTGAVHPSNFGAFDVVILCEVIEHIRDIAGELNLIGKLLRDGGTVILRTQVCEDPAPADFHKWWYAQDPTHIRFFSQRSLRKTGELLGKMLETTDYPDIFIM